MYDLLILGNGAIGTFTAYQIAKNGCRVGQKIGIIGDPERNCSATMAAGAMHAVFAELEEFRDNSLEKDLFELAYASRSTFEQIFEAKPDLKTADQTYVYLKKSASEFEARNFKTVADVANQHGSVDSVTKSDISNIFEVNSQNLENVICLKREYGFDARSLISYLDSVINQSSIDRIHARVHLLSPAEKFIEVQTDSGVVRAKKVINALGAYANKIMPKGLQSIEQYQGAGTAFIVESHKLTHKQNNCVIRTVNRGGAQCGIHVVPLNDGFYIGAGNYIAVPGTPDLRLDTLRYLLDTVGNEIIPQQIAYSMTGRIVQGSRPRSIDGFPIFGSCQDPRIIFATGFNRVALSCAPKIAELLINWYEELDFSDKFLKWDPGRKPISFSGAKEEFILSRISNAIEHGLIQNFPDQILEKRNELETFFKRADTKIKEHFKMPASFQIHPDMYGILMELASK